jgi:hypothetical protein
MRASPNDTVTRYYWVQTINQNGNRSQLSTPVAGVALSSAATVIPVSQTPANQNGVGGGISGRGTYMNRLL